MNGDSKKHLKILHLTAPAPFGGLERVVTALASGHQARGHEVHVAAIVEPHEADHPFLRAFDGTGVRMHPLPIGARAYWKDWQRTARLCREIQPDVVHSHSVRTDVIAARAARRKGRALLTTVHGASLQGGKSSIYEWLQLRSYRRFDAVVSVSARLESELAARRLAGNRLRLVPNAWPDWGRALSRDEARRALDLRTDAFVVGWVARMIPVKGADLFLDALDRLGDFDGEIVLIGDGPSRAALERRASRLSIRDRVHFLGGREHAARYFRAFDLFVMSSRSEGMPIAIFEAVSAGIPIVSTAVGGIPEMLRSDEALLVPSEDAAALADALLASRADPESGRARADRASQSVRARFDLDVWLDRYETLYREILEDRSQ